MNPDIAFSNPVLLTPAEMGQADRITITGGVPGIELMEKAGQAVASAATKMIPATARISILCGPGNNGGDGFIAARCLAAAGHTVRVHLLEAAETLTGDALQAYVRMSAQNVPAQMVVPDGEGTAPALSAELEHADLIIDALFGAGLDRPLAGSARALAEAVNRSGRPVLAVDLPSGVNGATGADLGAAVKADATVTFFRRKPGHLLDPGRCLCGPVSVADIGIKADVLGRIAPATFHNVPELWLGDWPRPDPLGHKYTRGHAVVFGGPMSATGAARLSAGAALRAGAGLVTLASPPDAMMVNACHLTAVMLKKVSGPEAMDALLADRRFNAVLIGPGYGVGERTRAAVTAILKQNRATVLDADALTSFADHAEDLFALIGDTPAPVLLTPHDGEFARLFPDIEGDKLARARRAAGRSGAIVLLKGADTVVAAPDGRAAINDNAPPFLATAGSGDVLAGISAGLLAQGVPGFEAASQAVWLHGEAGRVAGPGLIAEDLAPALKTAIRALVDKTAGL